MVHSDTIADFLTRIRNGIKAQHKYVDIPWSRLKENIAVILKDQGFIENFLVRQDNRNRGIMRVFLKYEGRQPVILGLKRVSKPGSRRYIGVDEIPRFHGNLGLSIVSTSQGIMAGTDAKKRGIGGELVCLVW
jgi:small subunit ribosomal protein S8